MTVCICAPGPCDPACDVCNAGECPVLGKRARDVVDHALVVDGAKLEERAVIVTWLRAANTRPAFMDPRLVRAFNAAADLIERGEHLEPRESCWYCGAGPDDRCKPDCDAPR